MKEKIDKKFIEAEIKKLDPKLKKSDEYFEIATILLSGLVVGANVKKISDFLNLSIQKVKQYEKNLRKNGIWKGEKTYGEEWFKKNGGLAFWLDVHVVKGYLEKRVG